MAGLKLFLLGSPRVELNQAPVDIQRRKALALLAYLAVTGQPHTRDALTTLFWPGLDQQRGRAYLRRDLATLKTSLPGAWLIADRETVELNREAEIWLDTEQFQSLLAACRKHGHAPELVCTECVPLLTEAVALYTGDFLAGFTLRDSSDFDDWQFFQTESLRQELATTLERLGRGLGALGKAEAAIPHARRWVALDPLHEPAQRQLIHLYDQTGQPAAGLRQYEEYVKLLDEEFGLPPEEETTTLYEAIKAKRLLGSFIKAEEQRSQRKARQKQTEAPVYSQPLEASPALPPSQAPSAPLHSSPPPAAVTASVPKWPVFVARQPEMARLMNFLDAALAGQPRIVFITGEVGQGKTALLQAFVRQAQKTYSDLVIAGGNCNAYTGLGDPYLPFREILELLSGDVETSAIAGALRHTQTGYLQRVVPLAVQTLVDLGPDLLDTFIPAQNLLNRVTRLVPAGTAWLPQLQEVVARKSEQGGQTHARQDNLFDQYARVLLALARRSPLLLYLDDLQWADQGSMSLLFYLARCLTDQPILIVGAYRPAEVTLGRPAVAAEEVESHPLERVVLEAQRLFGDITLDLSHSEGRAFVEALLDSEPNDLGPAFRETLYRQTGGHPLFTLELLRGMQARGDLAQNEAGQWVEQSALDWNTLPARIEGAIGERIRRLAAPLQELLQVASVEGEEFTAEVVALALRTDKHEVVRLLSRELDKRHLLVQVLGIKYEGALRLSRYRFRHILIQRYLYQNLDEVERVHLHESVGYALERLYGEQSATVAVRLVRHFQEAGTIGKAVLYLLRAGTRARRLSANEEAIAHLTRALTLLETLPDTTERAQQELDVRIALGPALMLIKGHSAPEVEQMYTRAYELCQQIEESPNLFPALWGLWRFNTNRGNLRLAHQLGAQCLALAQTQQNAELLVEAHIALGTTLFFLGKFSQASQHFEQVKVYYDPDRHHLLPFLYGGFEPTVYRLCYEAYLLWMQGYPDRSRQSSDEVLHLARELAHPYSLVYALGHTTIHFQFRLDGPTVQKLAAEATGLGREHGFSTFLGLAVILHGWALVQQGQTEGLTQLRQGLAVYQNISFVAYFKALLANACLQLGYIDEGLATLADAMVLVESTEERFWEAEVYRLKGELLLRKHTATGQFDDPLSPEDCFLKAIDIAGRQQARLLELRAAVSLGRLWQAQGRKGEARQKLSGIYGWFSEGFETADLQEAKALLETLGGAVEQPDAAAAEISAPPLHTPASHSLSEPQPAAKQQIHYCYSADGARIAYATLGTGPLLIKAGNPLTHLEYDQHSPVWRHWWQGLARQHTLVRYDERGCGLSDWQVNDFSMTAWVHDLEAVANQFGLERFALLGVSQGASVAIAYAVRHPERVSHLILYGGYARGRFHRNLAPEHQEEARTLINLIRYGWGKEHPAFRQVFTTLLIPEGTPEQINWFNDLARITASPENAAAMETAFYQINVTDYAPQVVTPTLVLHAKEDAMCSFEEGRLMASLIPGARFVSLQSKNHILLEHEPAWLHFLDEVQQFLQT